MGRLELPQANAHYPLKVTCLPFHHIRMCPLLWDGKYKQLFRNFKVFLTFSADYFIEPGKMLCIKKNND